MADNSGPVDAFGILKDSKNDPKKELPQDPSTETPKSEFTEEEEREIRLAVEKERRILELRQQYAAQNGTTSADTIEDHEPSVGSDEPTLQMEQTEQKEEQEQSETEDEPGQYRARRRHIFALVFESKRLQNALGTCVIIWLVALVIVPALFKLNVFTLGFALFLGGVFVMTALICIGGVLSDLRSYKRWRGERLVVDKTRIRLTQKGSIPFAIDEDEKLLLRSRVEVLLVSKKWYLKPFDAWTVTFGAPGEEDKPFHDLEFIRGGKELRELFKDKVTTAGESN